MKMMKLPATVFFCMILAGSLHAADEGFSQAPVELSTQAASASKFPDKLLHDLLDWAVAQGVPGVVLGIATPDGVWMGTSGVSNTRTGEKMSSQDQIRLASATKPFTASLIWALIEDGILSLDDPVNKWLKPGLVPKGGIITIGMLLNHTSGLYDHEDAPGFWKKFEADRTRWWSEKQVLAITRAHRMNFYPGTDYKYCNTGYYILGMIAEAATGQKVDEMLRYRFFIPLGMQRTAVTRAGNLTGPCTPGYSRLDGYAHPVSTLRWNYSWDWTAGSGVSTAEDMLSWAAALSRGAALKPATLEKAWTVKAPSKMGYGFDVKASVFGDRRIGHTGLNPGTTIDWLFYPEKGRILFTGLNYSDDRSQTAGSTIMILFAIRNTVEALLGWNINPH
jgi:D-alanyl-D-alanine carboxypeptidase